MRCPTCEKPVLDRTSENWPFCSPRCQLIDLGRWAEEEYYIPGKSAFAEDEDEFNYQAPPETEDQSLLERKSSI